MAGACRLRIAPLSDFHATFAPGRSCARDTGTHPIYLFLQVLSCATRPHRTLPNSLESEAVILCSRPGLGGGPPQCSQESDGRLAKLITLQRSTGRLAHRLVFRRPAAALNITRCSWRSISLTSRVIDLCCHFCILLLLYHLVIFFRTRCTAVVANTHGAIDWMTSAPRNKDAGKH